jgi:hypothetical protein
MCLCGKRTPSSHIAFLGFPKGAFDSPLSAGCSLAGVAQALLCLYVQLLCLALYNLYYIQHLRRSRRQITSQSSLAY